MEKQKDKKLSFDALKNIFINAGRLWRVLWRENRGIITFSFLTILLVSLLPFLSNGVRGVLINELVEIAGLKTIDSYFILILGVFVFVALFSSLIISVRKYLDKVFYFRRKV